MTTSVLRPATEADLDEAASWVRNQTETDLWAGGRVVYPIEPTQLRDTIGWDSAISLTLEWHGAMAGFAQILERPGGRLHLARVIISPALRGQGLGRQLVQALVKECDARPHTVSSLNVDPLNTRAVALYTSVGFRPAESEEASRRGFLHMERLNRETMA